MMKIWTIAWKDTLIRFRDRNALILMIAAPLLVTAIIGSAFGSFMGGEEIPITDIPFILVNGDDGVMGQEIAAVFEENEALTTLLATKTMDDLAAAQAVVAHGNARAVLYIPPDFSERINPSNPGPAMFAADREPTVLQLYVDPVATITPNIIRGVVAGIAAQFSSNVITIEVTIENIVADASMYGAAMAGLETVLTDIFGDAFENGGAASRIHLNRIVAEADEAEDEMLFFDPFAFFGPSMGMFFLMFTALSGAVSILEEQRAGTLDRLLVTPTSGRAILLGKALGVMLTGVIQFVIFVLVTSLVFGLEWGNPFGMVLMVLSFTMAATSLGLIVAAVSKTISQSNIIGTPIIIISGLLGGAFIPATTFPDWLQNLSKLSINHWGMEGFSALTLYGLGVKDVLLETAVLSTFALIFFTIATFLFERRMAR